VLLAGERHRDGFELRLRALLGEPRRGDRLTLDRDAALLRHAPLEDLESLVSKWSEMGAATLAAAAAREIADFVIGAASSSATCAHLRRGETELDFEASWLAGFDPIPGRAAIDQLFAAALDPLAGEPGERADRLVDQWTAVRFSAIAQDDRAGLRRATAYLFAQALGRYLALATRPPSILAGALRTVAGEALAALGAARDELALEDVEAILATIEGAAGAPAELVDGWLLRIEEALRLEERTGGRLETLTATAPRVAGLLRGPEAISLETLAAARALRDPEARASADTGALLARIASATGAASAPAWAEAGAANPGPEGLDVLLTAAFLCEGGLHAGPAVLAAERMLASGESELACDLLCRGLAGAPGEAWRDEQLAALRPLWIESGLDVPFDFNAAAPAALERLQHGDGAGAARILRWLAAVDPGNAELHRNYGIARAIQGDIEAALTHFARASSDQDTQFAAGTLFQAGHPTLAMEVLDYASRWYTRAEQWLTFGAIAFQVMDNPRTMIAYSAAWELDPDAYDASNLNSWAGVLDEVGDYDRCEKIARRLIDAAGEDAMWASNGWHHLACAFIGQGKLEDATAAATRAIEMNPLPENEGVFAQTLERARSGERPPVPPELPPPVPRHPAYLALEDGDVKAIAESLAGDGDWEARLAVLRAARFRFGSDNYVEVTGKALETAERLIADSRGASELVARVARVFALEVREQALFARDPMPMLGDRGTRQAFYKEFRDRGGIIVGEPPAAEVAFEDSEVCPGTALPRASDYVALLAALAAGTPAGAIAGTGLDEEAYHAAAAAWGQALRRDPSLGPLLAAGLRQRG
jgi:tetratricopeptide (TPR) repeat protein